MNTSEFLLDLKHFLNYWDKKYITKYPDLYEAFKTGEKQKELKRLFDSKNTFFEIDLFSKFQIEQSIQLNIFNTLTEKIEYLINEYADFKYLKDNMEKLTLSIGYKQSMIDFCGKCMSYLENINTKLIKQYEEESNIRVATAEEKRKHAELILQIKKKMVNLQFWLVFATVVMSAYSLIQLLKLLYPLWYLLISCLY